MKQMSDDPSAGASHPDSTLLPDGTAFPFWADRTSYRDVYHVAATHPRAADANPGTAAEPWKTIGRAADLLQPGQKVVVHAGVYRECVIPRRGGSGPDSMIAYEAAPGEEVIVSGAEAWTPRCLPSAGWNTGDAGIWMADLPGETFGGYNPFLARNIYEEVVSYSNMAEMSRYMLRRGAVFVNGLPLKQVYRFAELTGQDGAFWVEEPGLRLHFRLPDDADPASATFEITVRAQGFAPREYGLGYIRVSGFTFERAADCLPVPQRAMVSTHRGHHWIIENNRIRWANACGLDVGNEDWKAPRLEHPFGRHIIRNNIISDCGVCGIAGCNRVDETLVEGNRIERIGGLNVEGMCEAAGLKFHGAKRVLIRNNVFRDHTAADGIWLDYLNENCRITGNLFHAISTALGAVYLEACREANLVDHNVFVAIRKSDWGLPEYVRGSGVSADGANTIVAHNLFLDIEGFAVSMNDRQPGRNVGGHPIEPQGHQVLNNIFAACRRPIFLAGNSGNISDGNLFDANMTDALFDIQNPVPEPKPEFAEWLKAFGQDAHSWQAPMEVAYDPATMTLRFACRAIQPPSPAVSELSDAKDATVCPGPFDPAACRQLLEGQTLTLAWLAVIKEAGTMRVYPKLSDRYLINPGKGWIVYRSFAHASEAAWAKASVGYARFNWRDVHTADRTFNWEPIDGMIEECRRREKHFAFGIMPVCVNSADNWVGMPDWAIAAGAKWHPSTTVPECRAPVWDDPVFLAKMGQLVSALAARYNGHPDIAFIDCRTFGNWGEWHLGELGGKDPGNAIKRQYIDQWAVFDRTHVVVPISGGTGMEPGGYGWYARDRYGFGAREDSSDYAPRWETCLPFLDHGPTIAEWSWPYGRIKHGEGWTGEKWCDEMLSGQILGSRYSYQPLGEWNSPGHSDADQFLAEKGDLVEHWQNRMGYWFRMTEAAYPDDLANGTAGMLHFSMRNDGVAPIYLKGHTGVVKAALLDAGNEVLAVATLKAVNPFAWKPGQTVTHTVEVAFPHHAPAAKIALGVCSRAGVAHPDIQLGIEHGTATNWYILSDMD